MAVAYDKAIKMFFKEPLTRWSPKERDTISQLIGEYAGRNAKLYCNHVHMELLEIPCVETILQDADEHNLPKYVCLLKWLAPEGIVSQAPTLLSEISKRYL